MRPVGISNVDEKRQKVEYPPEVTVAPPSYASAECNGNCDVASVIGRALAPIAPPAPFPFFDAEALGREPTLQKLEMRATGAADSKRGSSVCSSALPERTAAAQAEEREWDPDCARLQCPAVGREQTVLEPGESFEYTSGTPLDTPSGFMVGAYHMVVASSGENFDVAIPAFSLDSPHQNSRVH